MIEFSPGNNTPDWLVGVGGKVALPEATTAGILIDLSDIENKVKTSSLKADIQIPTLETAQKHRFGLIVGSVLRAHTMAAIEEHQKAHPEQKQTKFVIPGSTDAALTTYYREVENNLESNSSTLKSKATKYRDRWIGMARSRSDIFPEVMMADQLESRWSVAGYIAARSSMRDLTASYGIKMKNVDIIRSQFIKRK